MEEKINMPQLTLDPFSEEMKTTAQETVKEVESAVQEQQLTKEEQAIVDQFAQQIDVTNSSMVLQYGAGAQQKISTFSDTALENVRTKDMDEVGTMLTDLVGELKGFDVGEEQKTGIRGFFQKKSNQVSNIKAKYDKTSTNVEKIVGVLENHQRVLLKDIAILDELYEQNLQHYKELNMYILAGKQKLEQVRTTELPALIQKAENSGLPEDSQRANDLSAACDRFEKKVYDLELTRTICIQMAPQVRLIQNNDSIMSEKIQSTVTNTIPLWKNQMVIALGLAHSQQALAAQRKVTDMTNDLLKHNADALKQGTIETARESERGIVDIETLRHTNESLISTLDEVAKIQQDGRVQRRAAEQELQQIEENLKYKLLEIKNQKG